MVQITLKSDGSEIVPYNFKDLPVHAKKYRLSMYPGMSFAGHWHDDWEFVVILKGEMRYGVNGVENVLREGGGIFVNSRQMHSGQAVNSGDCEFLCVVFHPSLMIATQRMEETCVKPLCGNDDHPYEILESAIPQGREMLGQISRLYALCEEAPAGFEFGVLSAIYTLGFLVYQWAAGREGEGRKPPDRRLDSLRKMIGYIRMNYRNRITLEDIAFAGSVCRSGCCDMFQKILHVSPVSYLTDYRIEKSAELLYGTALPITEIALQCGFCSPSYYAEVFHKKMQCAPSEYRKREGG